MPQIACAEHSGLILPSTAGYQAPLPMQKPRALRRAVLCLKKPGLSLRDYIIGAGPDEQALQFFLCVTIS